MPEFDLIFQVPNQTRSGSKKVADLDAIDMIPLMSWLPDVLSQMYTGLQWYMKSCLEVMTMASPPAPKNRALGKTRHYILNIMVPKAARPGYGPEWKGVRFVG
jgi:hypothetical protein